MSRSAISANKLSYSNSPTGERGTSGGALWAVAAGNWAQQHWAGTFTDRNGNSIHEFAEGVEEDGRTYRAGDLIIVSLRWDDPWGQSCNDYDLELFGTSMLVDVLKTHPKVLVGSMVLDNPEYLTPDQYLATRRRAIAAQSSLGPTGDSAGAQYPLVPTRHAGEWASLRAMCAPQRPRIAMRGLSQAR